ncbi:MAG: hypothetical protein ACRDI2_23385, partial [Chloroflexota bacterium]
MAGPPAGGREAHTAAGSAAWLETLVTRLRALGVERITVRLDKGFFSRAMVATLEDLGVDYLLKLRAHHWVLAGLGDWHRAPADRYLETACGTLWGARLVAVRRWKPLAAQGKQHELLPD